MANDRTTISYWHDSLTEGDDLEPRPALPGSMEADVAIVGAGFSGLWTAYYLLRADPKLRVVVLERDVAGFGASGRNGGWCVGDQSAPLPVLEKQAGADAVHAMVAEIHDAVDEVGHVVRQEDIDCGYAKGGAILIAANERQLRRLRERKEGYDRYGHERAYTLLSPRETTAIVNATSVQGGLFTPNAAAVHPARLVRGIADAVERLGGVVHEGTAVRAITAGRVETEHGSVRAPIVVRATEAYTSSLEGQEREVVPLGNHLIATEPLGDDVWAEIGLLHRELFEYSALMLGYGQRTADGRIAWGGMAANTYYHSRVPPSPKRDRRVVERLRRQLVAQFPVLADVEVTHTWTGVLGVTRDLRPGVGLDRSTGLAWIGGYFGAGVAASNAAGRTLADLITEADTERCRLPWVDHRSKRWEPEPLRWLGVRSAVAAARVTDLLDDRR